VIDFILTRGTFDDAVFAVHLAAHLSRHIPNRRAVSALNHTAWTLGRWVAAGALEQAKVEDALYVAGCATGWFITMAIARPGRRSAAASALAYKNRSTWEADAGDELGDDVIGPADRGSAANWPRLALAGVEAVASDENIRRRHRRRDA
jgi:hypothetical protein